MVYMLFTMPPNMFVTEMKTSALLSLKIAGVQKGDIYKNNSLFSTNPPNRGMRSHYDAALSEAWQQFIDLMKQYLCNDERQFSDHKKRLYDTGFSSHKKHNKRPQIKHLEPLCIQSASIRISFLSGNQES